MDSLEALLIATLKMTQLCVADLSTLIKVRASLGNGLDNVKTFK